MDSDDYDKLRDASIILCKGLAIAKNTGNVGPEWIANLRNRIATATRLADELERKYNDENLTP